MNKAWYAVVAVVVVAGAFLLFAPKSAPNGADVPAPVEPVGLHTIRITADGFEPASITVKQGDSVTWANESGRNVWVASAMHPTHTAYPGSGIDKCGTAEAAAIFDACQGIASGSSWSFVFNEVGTWKYHDHLRATVFGSVIVE
jgi:plastocyanin